MAAFIIVIGVASEYFWGNFFMIVWVPYVVMPILDYVLPVDHSNLSEERVRLFEKDKRFAVPLYLVWFLDVAVCFWLLYGIGQGHIGQTTGSFVYYAICGA